MNKAYSHFTIKNIDEDQRIIDGIASTPTTDLMEDVVDPMGAEYDLPIPFLWQHESGESAIGHVIRAKPTSEGIPVRVQIERDDVPGILKDRLDYAWRSIKKRLVRGFSIGFNPIESEPIKGSYGTYFKRWRWLELSAVTIAANPEAVIITAKSLDTDNEPAASGTAPRSKSPGVTGTVKLIKPKPEGNVKLNEQILAFVNTRAEKAARMETLMTKAGEAGETLDAQQSEDYDTLEQDIIEIDKHLVRLRKQEELNKKAAVEVVARDTQTASDTRSTQVITVKPNVAKGITFTRYAMAIAACRGNKYEAAEYAKSKWGDQSGEIVTMLKAAVAAGSTTDATWAGPLATVTASAEFLELLRPTTLIGKIGGLRRVPFNTSVKSQTGGGTYSWVGQGAAKPVSALAFATVTLPFAKASGIIVITKELAKLSTPAAEGLVRDDMIAGMQTFLDTQFIDPAVAIAANVSPASITNGVTGTAASGTTEAAARADLRALITTYATNNIGLAGVVLIMSENVAFTLGTMVNAVGEPAFPGISITGGNILGIPVVTSNVVGAQIVAAHAPSILYADDDQTEIDVSEEASLQMDGAPDNPTSSATVLVSLWQRNLVGLRADRFVTWLKARANVVQRIHTVAYA